MAVRLAKNLEAGVRQRVGHDADLHADRVLLDRADEVVHLGARVALTLAALPRRQVEPPGEPVGEEALDLGGGDQIHDRRAPRAVLALPLAQDRHDALDVGERAFAVVHLVWNAFAQDLGEPVVKRVGRKQVRDGARQHDDMARRLLELAQPLEIRHR